MAFETVLIEQRDGVRYITLNRPDALNALNFQLIDDLLASLEECSGDEEVRAVVLAGAGKAFCSGDDLKSMGTPEYPGPEDELARVRDGYPLLLKSIRQLRIPVIASVHGYALGAGCDLVLACDFAIAAEDALLGLVFVQRGIAAGTALIPRLVSYHKACELLLLGDMFTATEAERLGLVNRVVPASELDAAVHELAARLADGPTAVIGALKDAMNQGLSVGFDEALEHQVMATLQASETDDNREGRQAFMEKRPPHFTGR